MNPEAIQLYDDLAHAGTCRLAHLPTRRTTKRHDANQGGVLPETKGGRDGRLAVQIVLALNYVASQLGAYRLDSHFIIMTRLSRLSSPARQVPLAHLGHR